MELTIPKLDQTVGAFGHYSAFRVVYVDEVHQTVDLISKAFTFTLHDVPFKCLLYGGASDSRTVCEASAANKMQ